MMSYVREVESKIRIILMGFCAFSFVYVVFSGVFDNKIESIHMFLIMFALSVLITYFVKKELDDFFEEEWDWNSEDKVERILNEFFCLAGVGVLYYFTQLGLMFFFFPEFENVLFLGIKMYELVFSINSIIMYCIYRIFFIKL